MAAIREMMMAAFCPELPCFVLFAGKTNQSLGVTRLERGNQCGVRRHPGVAGSRVDPFDQGAPRDLPDQRVLSPPRSCDKHTHRLGVSSFLALV